jgi:hypothetical protein
MSASLVDCVRDEVAVRLDDGAPLVEVEGELIESVPGLSEDERAAVWLFACHTARARGLRPEPDHACRADDRPI